MNGSNDAQSFAANFIHASQKVCSVCRQHVYPYTGGGGVSQYQCIIVVMDYGKSLENNNLWKAGGQIEFNFSYYSIIWILFLPKIIIHKFCCPPIQRVLLALELLRSVYSGVYYRKLVA